MKTQVINKLTRVKRIIPYSYKEIGTGIITVSKLFQLGNGAHQGSVPNNLRLRIYKGGPIRCLWYSTTILLDLYLKEMSSPSLKEAWKPGVSGYVREEFKNKGFEYLYNKPALDIAIQSSPRRE